MKLAQLFSLICLCLVTFSNCNKEDDNGGMDGLDRPDISISDMEVTEGDTDNQISVKVTLSGTNEGTAVISYSTIDKTAFNTADYTSVEGSLNFGPGQTEQTISIEIQGDEFEEDDEQFEILLLNPINANLINTKAVITILDDDAEGENGLDIPSVGFVTPLEYDDYDLVWNDEFQGGILDETCWNYEIGNGSNGWGNQELQYYKQENTSIVENDYLVIEARDEIQNGFSYTSSRLTTQNKKSFKYGRIDIRAALPEGQGLWPALWMLGDNISDVGWPACGEIDIMELVGNAPNQVHSTVHFGANVGLHQFKGTSSNLPINQSYADEFHVFSLIWEENSIKFLRDNQEFYEITPADMDGQPYPFNESFFFIFNVAVGGQWPGSPDGTTVFPQRMIVDYIRVFQ